MVSHGGGKEADDYLLGKMAKQVMLNNKQEFIDLVHCTLSTEDYLSLLKKRGIILP